MAKASLRWKSGLLAAATLVAVGGSLALALYTSTDARLAREIQRKNAAYEAEHTRGIPGTYLPEGDVDNYAEAVACTPVTKGGPVDEEACARAQHDRELWSRVSSGDAAAVDEELGNGARKR